MTSDTETGAGGADASYDYDPDDYCPNCCGEGVVYSCFEEWACVDPESGCDECERRCDWCKSARSSHDL